LTITSLTSGTYTLALLNSSVATLYTVYIRNLGGSAIPNAAYNITRSVAGTTVTVAMGNADTNGVFTAYLEFGASYTFELAAFGYASASTPVTATTLNPITIVLYSSLGVPTWNVTYSSIIVTYTGQPLVQGQTSLRSVNASYWLYDALVFTGACATYYYNNTLLLNYSCGATNNVTNTTLVIPAAYSGFVLQAFTVTANGTNNTFLTWIPILTSGSGGSPAYHKGIVALIAERFQAGDPTGLSTGAFSFLIIIASLLVATFIGGATVMSTLIFLLMLALFTFILPILSWWYFTIIAVVAVAWIYLRGG
jgi:hypothetical protein